MYKEVFTEETYDFKKAMQSYVREKIAPLLKENGFVKYGTIKYIREKNGLAQIIVIRIGKYEVNVFAYYLPIFFPGDYVLDFGIELTGNRGYDLLNGKYFTTIYEPEKFDRSIQFKNYRTKHILAIEKVYNAIREGIIPEMDKMNSVEVFVSKLKDTKTFFFGYEYMDGFRNNYVYKFIMAIDECINGDFSLGIKNLLEVKNYYLLPEQDLNAVIERLLSTNPDQEITKEIFGKRLKMLCSERREKYKLN